MPEARLTVTEYELKRCTRHCAITGRELQPGETFYSALVGRGTELERRDYSLDAWQGPPEDVVGWWKASMPTTQQRRARMAPNDVLLEVFDEVNQQPGREDMRYVLALLLLRRRVFRLLETENEPEGETLVLHCQRNDETYRVRTAPPLPERLEPIQDELARLLFAEGA